MSRGLGKLQRSILAALAARGGGDLVVDYLGRTACLAEGVHDLRAVSREMARESGRMQAGIAVEARWQTHFSRSIVSLAERGEIEVLSVVPCVHVDADFPIPHANLVEGPRLLWNSRQRRFVRLVANTRDSAG